MGDIIYPLDAATRDARIEYYAAAGQHPPFSSPHEGYAILLEEMRELERAVFLRQPNPDRQRMMRAEATQVAAMALRFITDCCQQGV
ncbi:MAG: hypothetical protein WC455_25195 [Dehalococcoidia bacterium]|jgi:hypothetical protein